MKNFNKAIFSFAAIVSFCMLFSCSKDKEGSDSYEFSAIIEQSIKTRTTFTSSANIEWKADDKVSLFNSTSAECNQCVISSCVGELATFKANTKNVSDQFYVIYPYSEKHSKASTNEISCVIPTIQSATAGSFDTNALVMAAIGTKGQAVTFKNTCALLKFTAGENIQSFTISANNKESLVGSAKIKFDASNNPTITCNGTNAVSLRDAIEKGKTYYIVVAPNVLSDGYTIRTTVNGKPKSKSFSGKSYDLKCNSVTDLGTISPTSWSGDETFESVDLGLVSGTEWSTMNVGATSVVDPGLYFQWGDVTGYTRDSGHLFTEDTYKFGKESVSTTKYNSTDKKTSLDAEDDAAHVNWGDTWRMPTQKDCVELIENTYFEWTNNYMETGISGYIVYAVKDAADKGKLKNSKRNDSVKGSYSTADKHIFLPVTGYFADTDKNIQSEDQGFYWVNTLSTEYNYSRAYRMYLYDGTGRTGENLGVDATGTYYRHVGRCIRPVR